MQPHSEPPHPFDIIVFNEILYYFPDPHEQLRRYQRYLAPQGLFIISMFYSVGSFRAWKAITPVLQLIDQVRVTHRGSHTKYDIAVFTPR
jgi:2-polyprenyl-3-methyl-5-hydroxy-6-metoxy-1,4-benzoquinol methylase